MSSYRSTTSKTNTSAIPARTQFARARSFAAEQDQNAPVTTTLPDGVQAKLRLGAIDDSHEREADRVADQIMRMPAPAAPAEPPSQGVGQQGAGGNDPPVVRRMCSVCDDELAQRQTDEQDTDQAGDVHRTEVMANGESAISPDVSSHINAMRGGGQPLPGHTRNFFEPRFGHDFSQVRIHNGARAASTAQSINARAFTVGRDIVFGAGEYSPETQSGKHLLAHELTHVVQQNRSGNINLQSSSILIQRLSCRQILEADETTRVGGVAAHSEITRDYRSKVGDNARGFRIPSATSNEYRTETCGDPPPSYIPNLEFDDIAGSRRGDGIPDLGYVDSQRNAYLAEIKIGTFQCRDLAIRQLDRYVEKGNEDFNAGYRSRIRTRSGRGINEFRRMPPSFYPPRSPIQVGREQVSVAWCGDGQLVYKPVGDTDPEIYICGQSDQGVIDDFLDLVLGRAQSEVSRYIDEIVEPAIDQAISNLTIEEAITQSYQFSRPAIRDYVVSEFGESAWTTIEMMNDQMAVRAIAELIDSLVEENAEELLRSIAQMLKQELLNRIRASIQSNLRQYLQTVLNELCLSAVAVSAAMVITRFLSDLTRMVQEAVLEILADVVKVIAITALVIAILVILAIVVVVAVIVFLLPEIAAALGIGGGGAAVVGGGGVAVTTTTTAAPTLTVIAGGGSVVSAASAAETITQIAASILIAIAAGSESNESNESGVE